MDCNPQLQSISIPTSRGAAASLDFPARRRANVFRHLQLQARKTDASHQIDQRARGVHSAAAVSWHFWALATLSCILSENASFFIFVKSLNCPPSSRYGLIAHFSTAVFSNRGPQLKQDPAFDGFTRKCTCSGIATVIGCSHLPTAVATVPLWLASRQDCRWTFVCNSEVLELNFFLNLVWWLYIHMHIHSEMHAFVRMTECMFARALMFDWHWHRLCQAGSGRPSASEGAVAWWLPWEAGECFLPISLCGVIVFDSPSRPLLLPSSSSSARPPFVTQTLSHTIFHTHNNFVTHNLSHNSFFTHNLSHNNFVTHNLSHNNFVTHTTLSHTIFHTTTLSHAIFRTTTLSHTSFTQQLFHTHLSHNSFVTHNFVTHNFATHSLSHSNFVTDNFVTDNLSHNNFVTRNLSHNNFVTHIFHTTASSHIFHTTTLSHSQLCHTQQLCHTHFSHTHTTLSRTHTTLSHTIFHTTALSHTTLSDTTLSHTIFHTTSLSLCVAGVALGDIDANTQTSTQPLSHTPHSHATLNTQTSTHNAFTQLFHTNFNTQLFHTQLRHTHLFHGLGHTQLFHTQLFHTQIVTHDSFTHSLSHKTLLHNSFTHCLSHTRLFHIQHCHTKLFLVTHSVFTHAHTHTQLFHTQLLYHTQFFHTICVPPSPNSFPIPFSHLFWTCWKKLTCGVIQSFSFGESGSWN